MDVKEFLSGSEVVTVIVDVNGVFFSTMDAFGSNCRVEYKELMDYIRDAAPENVDIEFRACTPKIETAQKFRQYLQTIGYVVFARNSDRDGKYRLVNDLVAELAFALGEVPENTKAAIIFVGDGGVFRYVSRFMSDQENVKCGVLFPLNDVSGYVKMKQGIELLDFPEHVVSCNGNEGSSESDKE